MDPNLIFDILQGAVRSRADLEELARELGANLEAISPPGDLSWALRALIRWCDRRDLTGKLLDLAHEKIALDGEDALLFRNPFMLGARLLDLVIRIDRHGSSPRLVVHQSYPPKFEARGEKLVSPEPVPLAELSPIVEKEFETQLAAVLRLKTLPFRLGGLPRRVTLEIGDAELRARDFESRLRAHEISDVIRRPPAVAENTAVPLSLPIEIGFMGEDPHEPIFDQDTEDLRRAGAFRSVEVGVPKPHIIHCVGAAAAEDIERSLRFPPAPRLVVLDLGTALPDRWRAIPERLVEPGALAVLAVAGEAQLTGRFFRDFYRRLLDNVPLDRCIENTEGISTVLAVAENGELSMMLTRAPLEMAAYVESIANELAVYRALLAEPRPSHLESLRSKSPALDRRTRARRNELRRIELALRSAVAKSSPEISDVLAAELHDPREILAKTPQLGTVHAEAHRVARNVLHHYATAGAEPHARTRSTRVWVARGADGAYLGPWAVDTDLSLHIEITEREIQGAFGAAFPEEAVEKFFGEEDRLRIDVRIFCAPEDFEISDAPGVLILPRTGDSTELITKIRPLRTGPLRLRIALYFRKALIQSLTMAVEATPAGALEGAPVQFFVDWVANPDFQLLDEQSQPRAHLFTNAALDGTHWIGFFAGAEHEDADLRTGDLHVLTAERINKIGQISRAALTSAQGVKKYRFLSPLSEDEEKVRAEQLINLAVAGWKSYASIFFGRLDNLPKERLAKLKDALADPGIVSIARCKSDGPSLPWAAFYDEQLDTGRRAEMSVCSVFLKQLREKNDLLDQPTKCRALPECPLRDEGARETVVCPFGFWGFRHAIEQPLAQLENPVPPDELPKELSKAVFQDGMRVPYEAAGPTTIGIIHDPKMEDFQSHKTAISDIKLPDNAAAAWLSARATIKKELESGDSPLYYVFCHGARQGSSFVLKLKSGASPETLDPADLDPRLGKRRRPFLILLNGCETVALVPETIHDFIGHFKLMGAVGVLGTEIEINNLFARPFAVRLLESILSGRSVGSALLEARHHFLRSLNPLGLAYTNHSAADLHLHPSPKCARGDD